METQLLGLAVPVKISLLEFKPNTKPSCKVASFIHSQSTVGTGSVFWARCSFLFAPSPILRLEFALEDRCNKFM